MEISIERATFLDGLQLIQGAVDNGNSMPVLANVLIRTNGDSLEILATDLDVGIKESLRAAVASEGAATVPARKLYKITKGLPEGEVTLKKLDNGSVEISSGKANFRLVGMNPEDFPELPSCGDVEFMEMDAAPFREMLKRVIVAVSTDETRYNLNGVFFEKTDDALRLVATDGHRLAFVENNPDNIPGGLSNRIIARKGVSEFKKLLGDGKVEIGFSAEHAFLKCGSVVASSRLIAGEYYPNYRQVVPSANGNSVVIGRRELSRSLNRISVLSDERTKGVKLDLSPGCMTISTVNSSLGDAREELEIDYTGKEMTVGFSSRYLLDFLGVMNEENVAIHLADEQTAALIRDGDREDFSGVVMPLRI